MDGLADLIRQALDSAGYTDSPAAGYWADLSWSDFDPAAYDIPTICRALLR